MRALGFGLLLYLLPLGAFAADCAGMGSTNINRSYEIDRADIEKCMQEGKDPPQQWIRQGGEAFDVSSHEGGVGPVVSNGLKSSNGSVPYYQGTGCGYVANHTHPGGQSDNGAREGACGSTGDGGFSFDLPSLNFPKLPDLTRKIMNCITNYAVSVQGDYSKMCISGSAKFCGMNVGGGQCAAGSGAKTMTMTNLFTNTSTTGITLGRSGATNMGIFSSVAVSGPTTAILSATGQVINIPSGGSLYADDSNGNSKAKLHVFDAFHNSIGNYALKGGTATVATPEYSSTVQSLAGSLVDDGLGNVTMKPGSYAVASADTSIAPPSGQVILIPKTTNLLVDMSNNLHVVDGTTALETGLYSLGNGSATLGNAGGYSAVAPAVGGTPGTGYINLSPQTIDENQPQFRPNGAADDGSALPDECYRRGDC